MKAACGYLADGVWIGAAHIVRSEIWRRDSEMGSEQMLRRD